MRILSEIELIHELLRNNIPVLCKAWEYPQMKDSYIIECFEGYNRKNNVSEYVRKGDGATFTTYKKIELLYPTEYIQMDNKIYKIFTTLNAFDAKEHKGKEAILEGGLVRGILSDVRDENIFCCFYFAHPNSKLEGVSQIGILIHTIKNISLSLHDGKKIMSYYVPVDKIEEIKSKLEEYFIF